MAPDLGKKEGYVGHLINDPFRVGALLAHPLQDIHIPKRIAHWLNIVHSSNLEWRFEEEIIIAGGITVLKFAGFVVSQNEAKGDV